MSLWNIKLIKKAFLKISIRFPFLSHRMRLGSKPRTPEGTAPFSGSPGSLSDCLKIKQMTKN